MSLRIGLVLLSGILLWNGCQPMAVAPVPDVTKQIQIGKTEELPARLSEWRKLDLTLYPDADNLLLDDEDHVTVRPDGTYTVDDDFYVYLKTEKGCDGYRSYSWPFNEFYERTPEITIEIIKPDNSVVHPAIQSKIVTEPDQMNSAIFDPANKLLTMSIPGLEIGDIVRIHAKLDYVRARMPGSWCDIGSLQGRDPILRYVYSVAMPETLPLRSITVKNEVPDTLEFTEKKANGSLVYRWEAKNVPQICPEPDMPPVYLCGMRVLVSTVKDWSEISRWYYNLCKPHLETITPEMVEFSQKLAKDKSEAGAIRAIFDFVSKEIRYTGVTNEINSPGNEPHDVKQTFEQRFGVCRDKAALLAAMLQAAGFDAYPVLFMAGRPKDPETPNSFFNHAITGVHQKDGSWLLMDSTDENTADLLPAYAMDKSYLPTTPDGDTLRRSPEIPVEKNLMKITSHGTLDAANHLKMHSRLEFKGINDSFYRGAFAQWTPEVLRQFITSTLMRIQPGIQLKKYTVYPQDVRNLNEVLALELEWELPDMVDMELGNGLLRVPLLGTGISAFRYLLAETGLSERRYPLLIGSTAGVEEECFLQLPGNLKVAALPEYPEIKTGPLQLSSSIRVSASGELYVKRNSMLTHSTIEPEEYPALKSAMRSLANADRGEVVVTRNLDIKSVPKFYPGALSEIESNRTEIFFDSPEQYRIVVKERRKILQYGGVKSFSQWKASFYPDFESVKLLHAKVITPDGKETVMKLESIQIMDAPDAGGAPRYPEAKLLVLPLSGVVPGAVTEVEYESTRKGDLRAAFWFALKQSGTPILQKTVVLHYPKAQEKCFALSLPEDCPSKRSETADMVTVEVTVEAVPPLAEDPATPPAWSFVPGVGISAWDSLSWGKELEKRFNQAVADGKEAQKLASELTKDAKKTTEKLRIIRDFVAKNIRSAGPELNQIGWKALTSADTTLRERYGNSADRAALLAAMLKAVGFSNVKLIPVSEYPCDAALTPPIPINLFGKVLLKVTSGAQAYYLNDTDQYSSLLSCAHANKAYLDLEEDKVVPVLVDGIRQPHHIRQEFTVRPLTDGAAEVTLSETYLELANDTLRRMLARQTPEERRKFEQELTSNLAEDAEFLECRIESDPNDWEKPSQILLKVRIPHFYQQSGGYGYFTLPADVSSELLRTIVNRTLPSFRSDGMSRETIWKVTLPWKTESMELSGKTFELTASRSVADQTVLLNGTDLTVERNLILYAGVTSAMEYPQLVKIEQLLRAPGSRLFLFKVSGK